MGATTRRSVAIMGSTGDGTSTSVGDLRSQRQNRKMGFKFLEHTADAYIAAFGASLEECFENAGLALFETMTDTERVTDTLDEVVEVSAQDEVGLLYSWLERLLVMFDTSGNLYSKFKVERVSRTEDGYSLLAEVWGEPFNPAIHVQRTEVKAVTYHRMEVEKKKGRFTARFILDL